MLQYVGISSLLRVSALIAVLSIIFAGHLSMRHINVRAWRALVGSLSEVVLVCVYVCMYVCMSVTGLCLKYTRFTCPTATCALFVACCGKDNDKLRGPFTKTVSYL